MICLLHILAVDYYTRCRAIWMRPQRNQITYTLRDSIVTDCEARSEYGSSQGLYGPTGTEVRFNEQNVVREGPVSGVPGEGEDSRGGQ